MSAALIQFLAGALRAGGLALAAGHGLLSAAALVGLGSWCNTHFTITAVDWAAWT